MRQSMLAAQIQLEMTQSSSQELISMPCRGDSEAMGGQAPVKVPLLECPSHGVASIGDVDAAAAETQKQSLGHG